MSWLYLTTLLPPHRLEMLAHQPTSLSQSSHPEEVHLDNSDELAQTPRENTFNQQKIDWENQLEYYRRSGNYWYNNRQTMPERSTSSKGSAGLRIKIPRAQPGRSPPSTSLSPLLAAGVGYGPSRRMSSTESLNLVPKNKGNARPTERNSIERKREKHLQKMMGQAPITPSPTEAGTASSDNRSSAGKPNIKVIQYPRSKSPTKRFFDKIGSVMPTFTKSSPEGPKIKTMSDNVPPKAAQVLGTSDVEPIKTHIRFTHKKNRSEKPASVPARFSGRSYAVGSGKAVPLDPADVGSHLPKKVKIKLDQPVPHRPRAPLMRPRSQSLNNIFDGESLRTGPPTPRDKDAPPNQSILIPPNAGNQPKLIGVFHHGEQSLSQTQSETLVDPGNLSPTRKGGFAVKEHVTAIEKVPSVYSMRAALEQGNSDDNDGKSNLKQHSLRTYGKASSEKEESAWRALGLLPGGLLPSTIYDSSANEYSPSIYSVKTMAKQESPAPPKSVRYEVSDCMFCLPVRIAHSLITCNTRFSLCAPLHPHIDASCC